MIRQFLLTFNNASLLLLFLIATQGASQSHEFMISQPMPSPIIDGDVSDWNIEMNKYELHHTYGDPSSGKEDIGFKVMTGYEANKNVLFIAAVIFDDQIHPDQEETILYLNLANPFHGSPPMMIIYSNGQLELVKKSTLVDPRHQGFTLDRIEHAVQFHDQAITHEWSIQLPDTIGPGDVLGIDFYHIDYDADPEAWSTLLWSSGLGKSGSSSRMGQIYLADSDLKMGTLSGHIQTTPDTLLRTITEVRCRDIDNPNFWFSIGVDQNGQFASNAPAGTYQIELSHLFNNLPFGANADFYSLRFESKSHLVSILPNEKVEVQLALKAVPRQTFPSFDQGLLYEPFEKNLSAFEAFESYWRQYLDIPGSSIAIIQNNDIVYTAQNGLRDRRTQLPVTAETVFEAASITKSVFAVILLRLVERGLIDLDKPLYEYLPFPNLEKDERYHQITARLVLNHQTGLGNWMFGGPGGWANGGEGRLQFEPGTAFGYSGEAFNYLGRVVEHVTGKKLPELFDEEVRQPFGLQNTYLHYSDDLDHKAAMGHYDGYPNYKGKEYMPSPASSLFTNAADFARFAIGIMEQKHLSSASYKLITEPFTTLKEEEKMFDPKITQYLAHGFFVQETHQGKWMGHGGNNGDFKCKYVFNPEHQVGFVILTNSNIGDEYVRKLELLLLQGNPNKDQKDPLH